MITISTYYKSMCAVDTFHSFLPFHFIVHSLFHLVIIITLCFSPLQWKLWSVLFYQNFLVSYSWTFLWNRSMEMERYLTPRLSVELCWVGAELSLDTKQRSNNSINTFCLSGFERSKRAIVGLNCMHSNSFPLKPHTTSIQHQELLHSFTANHIHRILHVYWNYCFQSWW